MCLKLPIYCRTRVADQIRNLAASSHQEKIASDAAVVLDSTKHMLEMVTRIQNRTQDIVLKEGIHDITDILNRALSMTNVFLEMRGVQVHTDYDNKAIYLLCDPVHLQETFHNIIVNAAEAMESVCETRKQLTIVFKDNGKGISQDELFYLFDPFYSTKHRKQNFGLGLTYCYNVIQQHDGSIDIQSELNVGTTVMIQFPHKRIRSHSLPLTEVRDIGTNQGYVG